MKPETPAAIEARRDMMMGRWLGEMPTIDGKFYKWLMERRPDGEYTLETILMEGGKIKEKNSEFGYWGVSGHLYFTLTRETLLKGKITPLDTNTANLYDGYEILQLGEGQFRYRHVETGNEYFVQRVPPDYTLE